MTDFPFRHTVAGQELKELVYRLHVPASVMGIKVFLDVFIGNSEEHAQATAAYDATVALLVKNAAIYGLPQVPSELSEEQQGILKELDVHTFLSAHPYLAETYVMLLLFIRRHDVDLEPMPAWLFDRAL